MMKIVKIVWADIDKNVYRNPNKYKKEWREILDASPSYTAEEFLKLDLDYYAKFEPYHSLGYCWVLDGEPASIVEELVAYQLGLSGPSYDFAVRNHPEDLIEERTDWEQMKDYADEMHGFLDRLCSYL